MIGVDGLDSIQLSKYENFLPNFKRIRNAGTSSSPEFRSIFPPDSIPAWGSIYTGLNPAEHGIINFVDPNSNDLKINFEDIHLYYKGKTFWDRASSKGKKVCILLPYSIYPPWKVNGVMVCRSTDSANEKASLKTFPESIFDEYNLGEFDINLFHGFPSKKNLKKYMESCHKRTIDEGKLALRFIKNYKADLYFIYFSALDAIQHTFWNYCDEMHPDYPGKNEFQDVIKDFYILIDRILGDLLENAPQGTESIVISDHGHGMRPTKLININEFLRKEGFLTCRKSSISIFENKELLKKYLVIFIEKVGIGNHTIRFIKKFPFTKQAISNANYIDFDNTVAYLSAISGIKSYPEGGILLNIDKSNKDFDRIANLVITKLQGLKDPDSGIALIKWACRREELYEGTYINRYPHILFELANGYGVGWGINTSLICASSMSRFQPGSHKRDSAVFIMEQKNSIKNGWPTTLTDISPFVLDIIECNDNSD